MNPLTRPLVALAIATSAALGAGASHADAPDNSPCVSAPETAGPYCGKAADSDGDGWIDITEDDPRWDCHTMGNLICGPMTDEVQR